jgi:hypothetical protein
MLGWFDNVGHYWFVVAVALLITTLLAVVPAFVTSYKRATAIAFVILLGITLLAGRWPTTVSNQTLEYDESFNVANAMTAAVYPIPWKSYDTATVGPLEIAFIALPKLVGITPSYNSTHAMTVILLWIMLACLYIVMRRFTDEAVARVATLPALIFLTLTFNSDFQQYASELCSMLFSAIALAIATIPWTSRRVALWSALGTGVLIGALPFAKAQSIPIGALFAVVFLAAIPWRRRADLVALVGTFVLGLLAAPVIILGVVAASGAFGDFVMSYIKMQTSYVAGTATPFAFIFADANFAEYVLVSLAVTLIAFAGAAVLRPDLRLPVAMRLAPLAIIAFLGVSLEIIFIPHKPWTHYVLFLIPPLILLVGASLELLHVSFSKPFARGAVIVCAALVILVPMAREARHSAPPYVGTLLAMRATPEGALVSTIHGLLLPNDKRVAIWGSAQDLYPRSGALMGTRDNNTYFQMVPNPQITYFRDRFVADVADINPRLFIDDVAPGQFVADHAAYGYETLPGLKAIVDKNYSLVCTISGVRIFERRADVAATLREGDPCLGPGGRRTLTAAQIAQLAENATKASGSIDSLTTLAGKGSPFVRNTTIYASGWAVDPVLAAPGAGLIFIIDGKRRIDVSSVYGTPRDDVATALKSTAVRSSGFAAAPIPLTGLPPGPHTLRFGVIGAGDTTFYGSAGSMPFAITAK